MRMVRLLVWRVPLVGVALWCGLAQAAGPRLPPRDLTVELRQVEEGREAAGRYAAGQGSAQWEPQMLQVRNGEKAVFRVNDAIPMQWSQAISAPAPAAAGGSAQAPSAGAGVTQALVWFDAGHSLSVQAKWAGGNKPAVVELEVQRAAVGQRKGAELPQQTRQTFSTTLTMPLAEWVTVAATGQAPKAGVYSSEASTQVRRLLQVRVMAP